MSEDGVFELADLRKRSIGRVIDAFVSSVLAALTTIMVTIPFAMIVFGMASGGMNVLGPSPEAEFLANSMLLVVGVAVVAVVVRYEVVKTARTGQTFGMKRMGLVVVSVDGRMPRFWVRWALPHGAGLVAGLVGSIVGYSVLGDVGLLVGAGAGLVGWVLVYASALWDKEGRGWHDKAAGTIMVSASDEILEQQARLR